MLAMPRSPVGKAFEEGDNRVLREAHGIEPPPDYAHTYSEDDDSAQSF